MLTMLGLRGWRLRMLRAVIDLLEEIERVWTRLHGLGGGERGELGCVSV